MVRTRRRPSIGRRSCVLGLFGQRLIFAPDIAGQIPSCPAVRSFRFRAIYLTPPPPTCCGVMSVAQGAGATCTACCASRKKTACLVFQTPLPPQAEHSNPCGHRSPNTLRRWRSVVPIPSVFADNPLSRPHAICRGWWRQSKQPYFRNEEVLVPQAVLVLLKSVNI